MFVTFLVSLRKYQFYSHLYALNSLLMIKYMTLPLFQLESIVRLLASGSHKLRDEDILIMLEAVK